ncbi:hypothetical protein L1887_34608 [Cichorium endivia]|nr:hypothetical protein L1887_34608 [Cichorium endivia]
MSDRRLVKLIAPKRESMGEAGEEPHAGEEDRQREEWENSDKIWMTLKYYLVTAGDVEAGNRYASKGGRRSRVVNQGRDTPDVGEEEVQLTILTFNPI